MDGVGYFFANFNPSLNYTFVIYITWIHFAKTSQFWQTEEQGTLCWNLDNEIVKYVL